MFSCRRRYCASLLVVRGYCFMLLFVVGDLVYRFFAFVVCCMLSSLLFLLLLFVVVGVCSLFVVVC